MPARELGAVVVGGLLGTGARLTIDLLVPDPRGGFPASTLVVNVVGAFALGMLVSRVWPVAPAWVRAGLGAGLLGSFTTFSALAVSMVVLTEGGAGMLAVAYLVTSAVLGFGGAWVGLSLGRRARGRPPAGGGPTHSNPLRGPTSSLADE